MRPEFVIRPADPRDGAAVRRLNEASFDTPGEADLVEALQAEARPVVSLVAELGDGSAAVIGHICFSPMSLDGHEDLRVMGLGPMSVAEEQRGLGIGTALVEAGLAACRRLGVGAVFVLGHPTFYPRSGFVPASRYGVRSEYDVPDDVFMVLELESGCLRGKSGVVRYHGAFGRL